MTKKLTILSTTALLLTFAGAQASSAAEGPKKANEPSMSEPSMSEHSMTGHAMTESKMTDSSMMKDSMMKDSMMNESMMEKSTAMAEVKTRAVLIYADWCGSCKVLDPKIKAIKMSGGVEGADFVVLDYTDKNLESFYAQAKKAGVDIAVRNYLNGSVKTGQLLLVDIDDEAVRGKVTRGFEVTEIVDAIELAVAAS